MTDDKKQPPVILNARRPVFENTKWRVAADDIADARTGATVENYLVLAPITARPDQVTGCTVLPIHDGKMLLLRNYRHPVEHYFWEAARGFIDPGETPAEAAVREAGEETGLVANAADVIPLGHCFPESSTMIARAALFAVEGSAIDPARLDEDEPGLGKARAFAFKEIEEMLTRHEIEDSTTCIAIHRYLSIHTKR